MDTPAATGFAEPLPVKTAIVFHNLAVVYVADGRPEPLWLLRFDDSDARNRGHTVIAEDPLGENVVVSDFDLARKSGLRFRGEFVEGSSFRLLGLHSMERVDAQDGLEQVKQSLLDH